MSKKKFIKINKALALILALITILSFVSCQQNGYEALTSGTNTPAPSEAVSSDIVIPTASPKTHASGTAVLFIGNSLTYTSEIPEKLSDIVSMKNCDITVREVTHPGYALSKHLIDFGSKEYLKNYIEDADIIILQELGKYQKDTVEAIQGFQELGGDKQYYFLETEYHNFFGTELKKLKDIPFIRSGFVHNQLIDNQTFKYSDLHMPNDSHPNFMYGYLAAFTVFCKIKNTSCSDYFTVDEMIKIIGEQSVKGVEAELESDVILKIQAAVDAALEEE